MKYYFSKLRAATLRKIGLHRRCFTVIFSEIFKNRFYRTPTGDFCISSAYTSASELSLVIFARKELSAELSAKDLQLYLIDPMLLASYYTP